MGSVGSGAKMFLDSVSQSAYWLRVLLCGLSDWSGGQFVALEGLHQWVPSCFLLGHYCSRNK